MMRIALVTNTPPPYRVPIFSRVAAWPGVDFHVIFCAKREPNRMWDLPPMQFPHYFLRERFFTRADRYSHHNPDVVALLWKLAPDVVITDGFNPTHLYAVMLTLARLSEDLILYSMPEFGYFVLPPELCTGSSIMPQKRNPDPAELVRGKTGRVLGDLVAMLAILKGLPLSYNRDLQEDKEAVFDAVDTWRACLRAAAALVRGLLDRVATAAVAGPDVARLGAAPGAGVDLDRLGDHERGVEADAELPDEIGVLLAGFGQ